MTRPTRRKRLPFAALAALATLAAGWSCHGEPPPPVVGSSGHEITILDFVYTPQRLEVAPGTTVVVLNFDDFAHTVTSAATEGTYVFGGVNGVEFDTGSFTDSGAFTIPATAPVGTVVPYFCNLHLGTMQERGEVAVVAGPAASE